MDNGQLRRSKARGFMVAEEGLPAGFLCVTVAVMSVLSKVWHYVVARTPKG